jgi:[ribosomal protein S18]-alanine N-acetyltransferase
MDTPAPLLRDATTDDLPALLGLESSFPGDRLSARQYRHHLRNPRARLRVATVEGRLVGSSLLLTRAGSRRARLYSIVVDPACRGRGVGRVLAEDVLKQAREAGCDRLDLEVRADNASAQALYRALGFSEQRRLPGYYDDGMDGVRLERATAPGGMP